MYKKYSKIYWCTLRRFNSILTHASGYAFIKTFILWFKAQKKNDIWWCYTDCKMFTVCFREPCLTPARVAKWYLPVLYWSRACCGWTVHKSKVGGGQCAVSNRRKSAAEWRVYLGGVKNIHHVFIQQVMNNLVWGIVSFKLVQPNVYSISICNL